MFLAIFGLSISSFALLVLQSTMGGLQHNLIKRSKDVHGEFVLWPKDTKNFQRINEVIAKLEGLGLSVVPEFELEVLLKKDEIIKPLILHGINFERSKPDFLAQMDTAHLIIPHEINYQIGGDFGEHYQIISPAHVNYFISDIPRMITAKLSDLITTEVQEVDSYHGWIPIKFLYNLIRSRDINRIRVYGEISHGRINELLDNKFNDEFRVVSWEEKNRELVWALSLENTVMISLFIGMSLLVSLSITSGLFIFFSKVKTDMASFWILGGSKANLNRASAIFLNVMGISSVLMGILFGFIFLYFLETSDLFFMPDVFVERRIPVNISFKGMALSFFIPTLISLFFSHIALNNFKKENNFLEHIRSIGN